MTEAPSKRRLPAWAWWCVICLGVPVTACVLALALSFFLGEGEEWPPVIFLLGLAIVIGLGIVVGLVAVSPRVGRYLAYAVAAMTILAWLSDYISMELGKSSAGFIPDVIHFVLFFPLILALPIGLGISAGVAITEWWMSGIRPAHPLMVYLGLAVLAWLVPIGGVIPIPSGHSDAAMEAHFYQHREQFEQLVGLLKEDYMMSRVAVRISDDSPHPMQARWNRYRSLFREAGLTEGLERSEDGTVRFRYWEHRTVTSSIWQEKGYTYSEKSLQPIVASLDQRPADVASNQCVYRKITDNWYMYYGSGDSFPFPHTCE